MRTIVILVAAILTAVAKMLGQGGVKGLVAENLLLKQQLLILNRTRRRAPNLRPLDRFILGLESLFLSVRRISQVAIVVRPTTLLRFH